MGFIRTKEGKRIQTTDGSRKSVNPLKSRTNRFRTNNKTESFRKGFDVIKWNSQKNE